jgi:predicted flap endonuclease-1-like 5' DNA nuclease
MASIVDIEGIGPVTAKKLQEAGVRSTQALLEHGATANGRKELAFTIGVDPSKLLEWVNHADLYRVYGIGSEYSNLLEQAGVDTVMELAQRNANALYEALMKTNEAKKLVRKMPTCEQVTKWISEAKSLPRIVQY